jgi:Na+/melibiose symporter-like transporter
MSKIVGLCKLFAWWLLISFGTVVAIGAVIIGLILLASRIFWS